MGMGARRKVWTRGPQRCLGYKRQSLMKGIESKVYPRKWGIHGFQAPYIVQEHGEEGNPRDKLLLANLGNCSS
jgi:hypothetical protein